VVVFEEKEEGKQEDDVLSVLAKQYEDFDEFLCVIHLYCQTLSTSDMDQNPPLLILWVLISIMRRRAVGT